MKALSHLFLSEFCRELALLVQDGLPVGEGLVVMRDDDRDASAKKLLSELCEHAGSDNQLSAVLEVGGGFPDYMVRTIRLGESAGRLDEALLALAAYYERLSWLSDSLRQAVAYPLLLLVLMGAVFVVLISYVLPIFHEVFAQAGLEMSATAQMLMNLGGRLSSAAAVLLGGLVLLIAVLAVLCTLPRTAKMTRQRLLHLFGGARIADGITQARFAMALSMAISSGIDTLKSLRLAAEVVGDAELDGRVVQLSESLEQGERFEDGLRASKLFAPRDNRLLALGMKTGRFDELLAEVAAGLETRAVDAVDERLRKLEPALVIVIALAVGLILFSVMLPLLGILSSLG